MTSFCRKLFVFLLFTLVAYPLTLTIWNFIPSDSLKKNLNYKIGAHGHLFTRLKEAGTFKDVDILFLGSSHTYRGFDPRIFKESGFTSFNLGSSAQTPIEADVLVGRYLNNLNPDLVIYEVYPLNFNSDGVEAAGDLVSNSPNDYYSYKMALQLHHIKVYNTLLYATIRDVFNLNRNFTESPVKGTDRYVTGGYVESSLDKPFIEYQFVNGNKWVLFEKQKKTFERVLATLRSKGCRIVLVQAPVTKKLFESFDNNGEIDDYFQSQGELYLNFNRLLDFPDDLFFDDNHLNQKGVAYFNQNLIRILADQQVLPPN